MDRELMKSIFKEMLKSGEIEIEIFEDTDPYESRGVSLNIKVDGELVSESYAPVKK
jgi:hypothetical protein